jgi:hypothetical protein
MKKLLKILTYDKKKRKSIDFNIPELRTSGIISDAKKKDLLSLCHCNEIPKSHWAFYENLISSSTDKENNEND